MTRISQALHIGAEDTEIIGRNSALLQYCGGEVIQRAGSVPEAMLFIVDGSVSLTIDTDTGGPVDVGQLAQGDYLGMTALTRQQALAGAHASSDTTVISVPRATLEPIVRRNPALAGRLDEAIEVRRRLATEARAAVDASAAAPKG